MAGGTQGLAPAVGLVIIGENSSRTRCGWRVIEQALMDRGSAFLDQQQGRWFAMAEATGSPPLLTWRSCGTIII
jgi:hypothetical protein